METIREEPEEILARAKFPDWIYWRWGEVKEEEDGTRAFYYQMARKRIKSKPITAETQIRLMTGNNSSD